MVAAYLSLIRFFMIKILFIIKYATNTNTADARIFPKTGNNTPKIINSSITKTPIKLFLTGGENIAIIKKHTNKNVHIFKIVPISGEIHNIGPNSACTGG